MVQVPSNKDDARDLLPKEDLTLDSEAWHGLELFNNSTAILKFLIDKNIDPEDIKALKESLPAFDQYLEDDADLNNIRTSGTYPRNWSDTIVKNAPTNDNNSKAGELIAFEIGGIFWYT